MKLMIAPLLRSPMLGHLLLRFRVLSCCCCCLLALIVVLVIIIIIIIIIIRAVDWLQLNHWEVCAGEKADCRHFRPQRGYDFPDG
jgi:Flp pilus assembly protein TadB